MINKVTLIGHLGADPEIKHLENAVMVGRFSLATNENYKDKNGEWQSTTDWHNVVVWRELAERAERQLKKGMFVYVEGKIGYRKYTDKDGAEKYITDITASTIRLLEKREGGGGAYSANLVPSADAAPPQRSVGSNSAANDNGPTAPESNETPPQVGADGLPF